MSLLESLRRGTDSTSTRILIGVVAFAFIFWGAGANSGADTSILATVDGVSITDSEFQRYYRRFDDRRTERTEEEEREFRQLVLENLIAEEALVQEADRLGIVVTTPEVSFILKQNTAFHKDGKFDSRTYERVLRDMSMSAERYEADIQRQLLLEKLLTFASEVVDVGDTEVRRAWEQSQTQVDLTFVRLPRATFLTDIVVSDADRDAFVLANGDRIEARYKEAYDRSYNLPRRYTLSSILLRTDIEGADRAATKAKAEELRTKAAGGEDFADLARTWSEDLSATTGGSMGVMTATQLDPVIAAAAEATPPGQVSAVVETGRGFQILKVEGREEARVIPLEEAKATIAVELLREEKVDSVVKDYASKLIDAWRAQGAPPRELTEAKRLSVNTTGPFPADADQIPVLGPIPLLSAVLPSAKPGEVLGSPFTSGDNTFVVQLVSRTEPDPATFESTKGMARAGLLIRRRTEFLEAWRADVVARARVEKRI